MYAADTQSLQKALQDIELPELSGKQYKLDHWKGNTVLLNFWASWCTPCQYEIPHLVNYQKRYADQDFQIISIGLDDKSKLQNVKRSLGINYPVLVTTQHHGAELLTKLGNPQQIIPYTLIIDRQGNITHRQHGEFDDEAFELFLKPLLTQPDVEGNKETIESQN